MTDDLAQPGESLKRVPVVHDAACRSCGLGMEKVGGAVVRAVTMRLLWFFDLSAVHAVREQSTRKAADPFSPATRAHVADMISTNS